MPTRPLGKIGFKESLRNLQTAHLDCVLIHNISREDRFPNFEETLSEKNALDASRRTALYTRAEVPMFDTLLRLSLFALAMPVAQAQDSLKFGNPGCTGDDREQADRQYFQLCHSADLKVPLWVGYELSKDDLNGPADRPSGFRQDRDLSRPGAKDKDYERSGYSRGHMAPAEDFDRSVEAIRTTFLMSNVVPQLQGVNGGRWAQLESAVRSIVRQSGRAYVFTGPIFSGQEVETIADGEVGVPTHTYKVVLAVGQGGAKRMYAVIMPNADNVTNPVNSYATTVRNVERRTGLDFFDRLSDDEERSLEARKETFPVPKTKKKPSGHQ
ncbi:MAG: DNA/RNA non-specific endonuclease [Acidobacteriota bacterium]